MTANSDFEYDTGPNRIMAAILNVLTALVLFLVVLAVGFIIYFLLVPDSPVRTALQSEQEPVQMPTFAVLAVVPTLGPTVAPTNTPLPAGLPPTNTPGAGEQSAQSGPANTLVPTLTPSPRATLPPATPTRTPTPTPTDTATPGPSPTPPNTRSPFPFTKDDVSPQYLQNFANAAGCNWLGIAGEVFNLEGSPVGSGAYQVHVWDGGIDARVPVGGAPAYGPSGYEQFLFDAPRVQDHNVQLETVNGTAVSQVYRVQTRASCNQNLLYFVFVQNH